jgi:hypothetical protein
MGLVFLVVVVVLVGFSLGWLAASGSTRHGPALRRAVVLIDELEREAVEVSDVDPFARAQLDLIRQYRRRELE